MFDKITNLLKMKNIFEYKVNQSELSFVIKTCDYRINYNHGIYTVFAAGKKCMSCSENELDMLIKKLERELDLIIEDELMTYFASRKNAKLLNTYLGGVRCFLNE